RQAARPRRFDDPRELGVRLAIDARRCDCILCDSGACRSVRQRHYRQDQPALHGRPTITTEPSAPRSGSRTLGALGSSTSESSTMNAYMCRPGATGIVIDHRWPSLERIIGDDAAFHPLKSPMTETRRALGLLSTNCCG